MKNLRKNYLKLGEWNIRAMMSSKYKTLTGNSVIVIVPDAASQFAELLFFFAFINLLSIRKSKSRMNKSEIKFF